MTELERLENILDSACEAIDDARRAFKKSRNAKRLAAFHAAEAAHATAAEACREEQARLEYAETKRWRLEVTADRREARDMRERQGELF